MVASHVNLILLPLTLPHCYPTMMEVCALARRTQAAQFHQRLQSEEVQTLVRMVHLCLHSFAHGGRHQQFPNPPPVIRRCWPFYLPGC